MTDDLPVTITLLTGTSTSSQAHTSTLTCEITMKTSQWDRLERELKRGPLVHGWDDEAQGWTLKRVKLLIGRIFHVGYTVQGVWKLLRRHGWSVQVPVRRALERDEEAIEVWKAEVWPRVKAPRRTWVPTSASRTSRGKA